MWNDSDAGGGFIPQDFPSPSQSDKRPGINLKTARLNHLVPISIRDMNMLSENTDTIKLGTHEVAQVSVVGIVLSVQKDNLNIVYEFDDGTSEPLTVKQWVDPECQSSAVVVENMNAKAIGIIRWWQGKVYLQAHLVLPIDNDEVECHKVEAEFARMYYEKDVFLKVLQRKQASAAGSASQGFGAQFGDGAATSSPVFGGAGAAFGAASRPMTVQNASVTRQGAFADQLYMLLKGSQDNTGMSIQAMQQRMNCPMQKLRKTLEDLCGEGLLYTTIDDDHYNTTDSVGISY